MFVSGNFLLYTTKDFACKKGTIILLLSSEGTVFLYLTRHHYKKTVPKGEDNNMFSTEQLILDIKQ